MVSRLHNSLTDLQIVLSRIMDNLDFSPNYGGAGRKYRVLKEIALSRGLTVGPSYFYWASGPVQTISTVSHC